MELLRESKAPRPQHGVSAVGAANAPAEARADSLARDALNRLRAGETSGPGTQGRPLTAAPLWSLAASPPRGDGAPLEDDTRSGMERAFGTDFSGVRTHTGPSAARAARSLQAHAFTHTSDIYFAAGRFQPHTAPGRALLAHELGHIVQQRSEPADVIRRQPDTSDSGYTGGGGTSGGGGSSGSYDAPTPARPVDPSAGGAGPTPASADDPVIELKGMPRFSPSPALAARLQTEATSAHPTWVHVRFGSVADSEIPVYYDPARHTYETPPPSPRSPGWGIRLHHAAFPATRGAEPMLWIAIRDTVIIGAVGWQIPAGLADPGRFNAAIPAERLYGGMADFESLRITGAIVNQLRDGHLKVEAQGMIFESGPFAGKGRFRVADEEYDLDAQLDVPVAGLPSGASIPVKARTTSLIDTIHGSRTWRFDWKVPSRRGGRIEGSFTGTIGNKAVDVAGIVRYASADSKFRGSLSLRVTDFDTARGTVRDILGPDAPATVAPARPGDKLAVFGRGELDFAFSDWLIGNAEVILHPEGFVTARGDIHPTSVIRLFRQTSKERSIGSWHASKPIYGLPYVADLAATAAASLHVYGWIGPGTVHDLRATGLISNDPAIINRFDFSGALGIPALAGLRADVRVGLAGRVLTGEVLGAEVVGNGSVELQLYGEAGVVAGRRPSTAGPVPEYFIKGRLDALAELLLRLKLALKGNVAFWSRKLDLVDHAWSLGNGAVRAEFEYVMGRRDGTSFSVDFGKLEFDAARFSEALVRKNLLDAKAKTGSVQGDATGGNEVVNPDAPPPPQPAPTGQGGTGATAPPGNQHVEVTQDFDMQGTDHELTLVMLEEPDLEMASPRPTSLLGRIGRVRRELSKVQPPSVDVRAQLTDLDLIDAQAKLVLSEAKLVEGAARYLTPDIPGFPRLAQMIQRYGIRYDVSDLEEALARVSVDPKDPTTVLQKFPSLQADAMFVATVSRILYAGVRAVTLRKIVDNHAPSQSRPLHRLLLNIDLMMANNVHGWEKVISDLSIGGNMTRGASWVLWCVHTIGSFQDLSLEVHDPDAVNPAVRRWDAFMSGGLYEFKWWYSWTDKSTMTFLRQINNDYRTLGPNGFPMLRWVFGPSPLTRTTIIDSMRVALSRVITDRRAGREPPVDMELRTAMYVDARLEPLVRKVNPDPDWL